MKYYSTNKQAPNASLQEAVVKGLAADKGLFMPMSIKPLPQDFYDSIESLSFQEIAYRVADAFFGEDVPADTLKQIVYDTLSFRCTFGESSGEYLLTRTFPRTDTSLQRCGRSFHGASAGILY